MQVAISQVLGFEQEGDRMTNPLLAIDVKQRIPENKQIFP